jgi:hypothetical protein
MRTLSLVFCFAVTVVLADEPIRRPLTTDEIDALKEPLALGQRVLAAWSRYSQFASLSTPVRAGSDVISSTPTLELLHATHSLGDSDFALTLHYQTRLHPVPPNATKDASIVTMRTDRGEIFVDVSGIVTLQPPK